MTNEEAIMILKAMIDDMILVFDRDRKKALNMAIEALKEQSKHDQNSMSKQPDLDTFGVKTGETCADAISRQDAIDAVEFGITYAKVLNKETGEVMELFKKSNGELQKAVDRIEALPSAQPEQRWIPVSERMPEESGWYIVTTEDETDTHLRWFSTLHGFEWEEKDNTIAWMPLPKPYEGES